MKVASFQSGDSEEWLGLRKAAIATARQIVVLMLSFWKAETDYQWTQEATA